MVQNAPEVADNSNWLTRFFRHPIVGMIASVATVLSLCLTIYFYFESTKRRDLVYFVNPVQAVVVKTGEASNLHFFYADQELKSDVTAAQIALWNQGNESIRPESVLQPVMIRTNPSVPILEATIRKKSREVVDISLDQSRLREGVVGMKWNILEHDDGAVIQLVYAGPPSTQIDALGVIEGQAGIRELKDRGEKFFSLSLTGHSRNPHKVLGFGLIALGILMLTAIFATKRRFFLHRNLSRRMGLIDTAFALTPFFYIALGICSILFLSHPDPPFGF
jgi:hypothetical protein